MLKRGFSFAPGYRLEQFLGRGQFGQVWRASAPGGAAAAIKFIDLSGGEGAKEHEGIKRVKQIRHANLMPITAIWLLDIHGKAIEEAPDVTQETITIKPEFDPLATADSLPPASSPHVSQPGPLEATGYLVKPQPEAAWLAVGMLLGGMSLQQRLRECVKNGLPGIPPKELLAYMDESAKGLDFLNIAQHDLGEGVVAIQHCDVKPANIVLIGSSAVVCDFGLARILSRNQVTATSASGTPAYMAPEAISGKPCRTSDQYSLAVTYYHLRTGTLPINDGTLWEVLDAHRTGKLDLSRVSENEQAVLKRATSLDWEKRFDSNGDFIDSLREALRAEGFTRPIMMPTERPNSSTSDTALVSPITVAGSALDPSFTMMPGQDITTPLVNLAQAAADTKNSAMSETMSNPLADMTNETPISVEGNEAWWLQPKWLAAGSIAIVAPMLLLVVFSEAGSNKSDKLSADPNESRTQPSELVVNDTPAIVQPANMTPAAEAKSLQDWLADVSQQIADDNDAAKRSFDEAVKRDASLLEPQPTLLTGLQDDVMQLAFSGDAAQLVAIGQKPEPLAWPIQTIADNVIGATSPSIDSQMVAGPEKTVECLLADPTGKFIATADMAGNLILSSFDDLQNPIKILRPDDGEAYSIAWSPDSAFLFAATSMPSIVFTQRDISRSDSLYRFDLSTSLRSIAIDPNGKWLLMLSDDGIVSRIAWSEIESLMNASSEPKATQVSGAGSRVSVMLATTGESKTESSVITGGEDGEVTLWTLGESPKPEVQEIHKAAVTAIAATPTGLAGTIATGDDNGVIGIWRANSKKPIVTLSQHTGSISSLDLSDDGRWLVAASLDGDVTLWDLRDDEPQMTRLSANAGSANCVAVEKSGRWIAAGHANGIVTLWDLRHAKMLVGPPQTKPVEEVVPQKPRQDNGKSV